MTNPPLIILGASVRAAAQAAARGGYQPFAIDLFADADLQQIAEAKQISRYPAEFLPALAAAPDAPWMYTGSLENYPRLVARLANVRPLIGNGPAVLQKVRDPLWLAEMLSGAEVRYPEVRGLGAGIRSQVSGVRNTDDWLVKPLRSGGGMGISKLTFDSRLPTPDSRFPTPDARHYLQRFVPGQPLSASFVARGGDVQWIGAAEQWLGRAWGAPQEFQYAGSLAAAIISSDEQQQLLRVAQRLCAAVGLQGLFGMDFIRNDEGLWLIEVNPRYTASMELFEQLTGRRLIAEHCEAHLQVPAWQEPPPPNPRPPATQGKLIVFATNAGRAGESFAHALSGLATDGITAADIPHPGTQFQVSNPICTLLAAGTAAPADTKQRLLAAAAVVRKSVDGERPTE